VWDLVELGCELANSGSTTSIESGADEPPPERILLMLNSGISTENPSYRKYVPVLDTRMSYVDVGNG
jgi:hypothetical protein